MATVRFGPVTLTGRGVWSANLRYGDPASITEAASELEQLGYSACWIPDAGGPVFEALDRRCNHRASCCWRTDAKARSSRATSGPVGV